MSKKDMFRTTVFGGYQKEDVMDYIRSLENENETIRILNKKESSGIKAQLEKEIAAGNELREALAKLKEENRRLEAEKEETPSGLQETAQEAADTEAAKRARAEVDQRWKEEVLDRDTRLQELLTELKKSNDALEEELKKEIRQLKEYMSGLAEKDAQPKPRQAAESSVFAQEAAEEAWAHQEPEETEEPEPKPEAVPEPEPEPEPEPVEMEPEAAPASAVEPEPEEQDVPDVVEPGEEDQDHGYHEKAYRSLRDIKEKAAGLLASLEDTGFGL